MPHLPKKQPRRAYVPDPQPKQYGNDAYTFYNSQAWRRLSIRMRTVQPLCEVYGDRPADVVDHIVPIEVDARGYPLPTGGAAYDERNLMCMSHKAHNSKRGKEAHGFAVESKQMPRGLVPVRRQDVIDAIRKDNITI